MELNRFGTYQGMNYNPASAPKPTKNHPWKKAYSTDPLSFQRAIKNGFKSHGTTN